MDNGPDNFYPKRLSTVTAVGTTRYNKKKLIELNPSMKSINLRTKLAGLLSPVVASSVIDNQFPKINSFVKPMTTMNSTRGKT